MFSTYSINRPYRHEAAPAYHDWNGFIVIGGTNMVRNKTIRI